MKRASDSKPPYLTSFKIVAKRQCSWINWGLEVAHNWAYRIVVVHLSTHINVERKPFSVYFPVPELRCYRDLGSSQSLTLSLSPSILACQAQKRLFKRLSFSGWFQNGKDSNHGGEKVRHWVVRIVPNLCSQHKLNLIWRNWWNFRNKSCFLFKRLLFTSRSLNSHRTSDANWSNSTITSVFSCRTKRNFHQTSSETVCWRNNKQRGICSRNFEHATQELTVFAIKSWHPVLAVFSRNSVSSRTTRNTCESIDYSNTPPSN